MKNNILNKKKIIIIVLIIEHIFEKNCFHETQM